MAARTSKPHFVNSLKTGFKICKLRPGLGVLLMAFMILGMVLGLAQEAQAQNRIWVGDLKKLRLEEPTGKKPYIEVELVEDQNDGRFGSYDIQKTIVWAPLEDQSKDPKKKKTGAEITLDGTFPGKFFKKSFKGRGPLIQSVTVKRSETSVQIPDLQNTKSGRQLEHAQLIVESSAPILVNTRVIKNLGEQIITLRFTISRRKENNDGGQLTNFLEFSTENFDRPSTKPIASPFNRRTQDFIRRNLVELNKRNPNDYVTAIYPARYADPNTLATMIRGRLSQLGRVDVDRDRSQLILTDRARFVINLIETLITLDRKPPQVTIVAQIIEVNRSSGSKIGVDFSYMANRKGSGLVGGGVKTSGIIGQDAILNGVYQNLSKSTLQQFAADVNMLVERKLARVAAQPVLRVLNNARGTFNSGETLPFLRPTSRSDVKNQRNFKSDNRFQRVPGEAIKNSQILEENRQVDDKTKFGESRITQGVTRVRTGTRLVVTPALRNSDEALLTINASYNELAGFMQPYAYPIISERSVDTRIRVRHGETIVIAGLYKQTELKQMSGIPFLSEIPVLGRLFQTERKSKETFDIIFILTTFVQHN